MAIKFYVNNSYSHMTKIICLKDAQIQTQQPLTITYDIYNSELINCLHIFKYIFMRKVIYSITFDTQNIIVTKFENIDWQLIIGIIGMFLEKNFNNTQTLNLYNEENILNCSQFNSHENMYIKILQTHIDEKLSNILNAHSGYVSVKDINISDSKFYVHIYGACTLCIYRKQNIENIICNICANIFPTYTVHFI